MIVNKITNSSIDPKIIDQLKKEQVRQTKGVYYWYCLSHQISNSFKLNSEFKNDKIVLYIGKAEKENSSIISRFIGECFGTNISSTKKTPPDFDTDFYVSLCILYLSENNIDVYFDKLNDNPADEGNEANKHNPLLQFSNGKTPKMFFNRDFNKLVKSKKIEDNIENRISFFKEQIKYKINNYV